MVYRFSIAGVVEVVLGSHWSPRVNSSSKLPSRCRLVCMYYAAVWLDFTCRLLIFLDRMWRRYQPDFCTFRDGNGAVRLLVRVSLIFTLVLDYAGDDYKARGVHRELATPEMTREFPATEATRWTSRSRGYRRWLRTATDSLGF